MSVTESASTRRRRIRDLAGISRRMGPGEAPRAFPDVREIAARSKEPIPRLQLNREEAANNTSLVIAIEFAGPRGDSSCCFPGMRKCRVGGRGTSTGGRPMIQTV